MPTVVGAQVAGGVALAADRRELRDGHVISDDCQRLHEIDGTAVGASGPASAVQTLHTRLADRVRTYEHRQGTPPGADALEAMLSELSPTGDTPCLASATDADGRAVLLLVEADGGSTREPVAAIGSGTQLAVGALDRLDRDAGPGETAERLAEILRSVAERDPETGETVDTLIVPDRE